MDWSAADAGRRANLLARQLMLEYAEAYLRGGDEALGAAHNERQPRVVADGFRALIQDATNLHALGGPLATYLERFPEAQGFPSRSSSTGPRAASGAEPSITLHHLVIHREPGGGIFVANKQLYASRYTDAGAAGALAGDPARRQGVLSPGGPARAIDDAGRVCGATPPGSDRGGVALVRRRSTWTGSARASRPDSRLSYGDGAEKRRGAAIVASPRWRSVGPRWHH